MKEPDNAGGWFRRNARGVARPKGGVIYDARERVAGQGDAVDRRGSPPKPGGILRGGLRRSRQRLLLFLLQRRPRARRLGPASGWNCLDRAAPALAWLGGRRCSHARATVTGLPDQ